MENNQIAALLKEQLNLAEAYVSGDGSHFQIIAVSDQFADMSRVKKQQFIYAPLKDKIADGSMHALTIKTYTEQEWERERKLNPPV